MARYYKAVYKSQYDWNKAYYEKLKEKVGNGDGFVCYDKDGEFVLVPSEWVDEYVITTLSKQDLDDAGFETLGLDDDDMNGIAEAMGEVWTGYGDYWTMLEDIANNEGVQRKGDDGDGEGNEGVDE